MMFALGIIDTLTPGELNGGETVAGTGTIDADGVVGPIGGIRQKMWGAVGAGADWFLAPAENCDEVVGHVPDGPAGVLGRRRSTTRSTCSRRCATTAISISCRPARRADELTAGVRPLHGIRPEPRA